MPTETTITVKYLEPLIIRKILRDRRDGTRLWRIARDTGLSAEVVREVLVQRGVSLYTMTHRKELKDG